MLNFAAITPHPPIIIPTIGQLPDLEKAKSTIGGMQKLAEEFAKVRPSSILIISPHGPVDFYQFTINIAPSFTGHFFDFGDFQTELAFRNNKKLVGEIEKVCEKKKILLRKVIIEEIDYGALVPLYYLSQNYQEFKVVPLAYSFLDINTHFKFGKVLGSIIKRERSKIGIIASGDLSHRLLPEAPAGYSPRGKEFDQKLIELLEKKDVDGILNTDQDLVEEAGECGYRSIIILLGVLSEIGIENLKFEKLSYEGPFGVGYLVADFKISNF
ncbi:MAG TPA: AmmeMemoRadiSam system protein B [Candidatus Pacearchaeota archaeon]|nr:AmmeMemoRadiSam system protein B [Candidatus Pacearchaeota archaeon]HOK94309.1 AmmeMemoRadiSam system protein B [Candidatus Pacearchaeota archaeon]HPO75335.1 AmmeMemoRadiSam system protein B [Candidatus Pacearchaeota archaeon]